MACPMISPGCTGIFKLYETKRPACCSVGPMMDAVVRECVSPMLSVLWLKMKEAAPAK